MRERVDTFHAKLGLPILKSDGYNPAPIAGEAVLEEQALLEEMGVDFYASGSQESVVPGTSTLADIQRAEPAPTARIHRTIYERILHMVEPSQMDAIDGRIATRLHHVNDEVFLHWLQTDDPSLGAPSVGEGQRRWHAMLDWLSETDGVRHVLAYLPFPELAVQCCSPEQLARWGEKETYL